MIGKVMASGRGAGGLVRYVTHERDARSLTEYVTGDQHEIGAIAYRNLLADEPCAATREMALTAKLSSRCQKPFMHVQLSWHPEERPTNKQMIEAMDRTLAKLGLEDRQAVYAIHLEKAHVHIHAAVNRVGADGRAWRDFRSAERFIEASREVEREMGFIDRDQQIERARMEGRSNEPRLTPRQQRIAERSGVEADLGYQERLRDTRERANALANRIRNDARAALRSAPSWADAHDRLAQHGLGLREFVSPKNSARKGLEVVEIATGERCAASDLGGDYGRARLEKRLGAFEPGPHGERLEALRAVEGSRDARSIDRNTKEASAGQERLNMPKREDSSLWRDYQADRMTRAAERERALDRQRAHERARRAAMRQERTAERERLRASGLRGAAWKAVRSELAFEAARHRQILESTIKSERTELHRDYGTRTWTEFVNDRAAAGDERALAQIAKWNRSNERKREQPPMIEQPSTHQERPTPVARTIADLQYAVNRRTGDVTYSWRDGRAAFTDHGSTIALKDAQDIDAIRASLTLASEKWGNEVLLEGNADFKRAATEIATDMRITISNLEMREFQAKLVAQREALGGRADMIVMTSHDAKTPTSAARAPHAHQRKDHSMTPGMTPKEKLAALEREREENGPMASYYERRTEIQAEIDAEERAAMVADRPLDATTRSKKPWADKYDTLVTERGVEYQRDGQTVMTLTSHGVVLDDISDQQTIRDAAKLYGDNVAPGSTVTLSGKWTPDDRLVAIRELALHPNQLQLVDATPEEHAYFERVQAAAIREREALDERLARPALSAEERMKIPVPSRKMSL